MHSSLLVFFGVSALMLYAMSELGKQIQFVAGSKFRAWLNLFTENKFTASALGLLLAMLLGSSSAVTVMLIGLANAQLLTLEQVFAVVLGAGIGTTFIVQLIALRLQEYGLILIAGGLIIESFPMFTRLARLGRVVFFLGLLFFCLELLVGAGQNLYQEVWFRQGLELLQDQPFLTLVLATLFTALIQSSAASISMLMSLALVHQADLHWSLPWILGSNLGSTTSGYMSSLQGGPLGRQAAIGNILIKVCGIVVCFPFLPQIARALETTIPGSIPHKIAMAHTLFNVGLAVIFLPFIPFGVGIVKKWVASANSDEEFKLKYLQESSIGAPELVLSQAQKEVDRLSRIVLPLVDCSIQLFQAPRAQLADELSEKDKLVDYLNKNIRVYLTRLSQTEMTQDQSQREIELLLRTNDLENIADIVEKNILILAKKTWAKNYRFSDAGWAELRTFHDQTLKTIKLSVEIFETQTLEQRASLVHEFDHLETLLLEFSENHFKRLHDRVKQSVESSSVHLDLLGHYQRMAALAVNFLRVREIRPSSGHTGAG